MEVRTQGSTIEAVKAAEKVGGAGVCGGAARGAPRSLRRRHFSRPLPHRAARPMHGTPPMNSTAVTMDSGHTYLCSASTHTWLALEDMRDTLMVALRRLERAGLLRARRVSLRAERRVPREGARAPSCAREAPSQKSRT